MLNEVLPPRGFVGGLDGKAGGSVAVSAGSSTAGERTVNGSPRRATMRTHQRRGGAAHRARSAVPVASMARLTANHAHTAALGHGAGNAALDDVAGGGIIGGDGGQELVELVVVAKLQQVALAHGLKQLNTGDGAHGDGPGVGP